MKITLGTLLGLIAKESDREEFLRLGRRFDEACRAPEKSDAAGNAPANAEREELLDQIMERIHWHFRAIRHPMPNRQEVEQMLREHFG